MSTREQIILAINPGTRYLGFAIIKQGKLIDWGVSVIEERTLEERLIKAKVTVSKYFSRYLPGVLVLKALHPALQSSLQKRQDDEFAQWAHARGCQIIRYSLRQVKAVLLPRGHTNKQQLAEHIIHQYPELLHAYRKEQDALNPYHTRMFEAVAFAMVADNSVPSISTFPPGRNGAIVTTEQ